MNGNEQEVLFARVRRRFVAWSKGKCSGYVHGILDERKLPEPQDYYRGNCDDYSRGYSKGFLDARGEDAFQEDWFKTWPWRAMGLAFDSRAFQWWVKK